MDFRFSAAALAFEREVKAFIQSEWIPLVGDRDLHAEEMIEEERDLRRKLAAKGWLTMSWPKEYGGRDQTYEEQYLLQEALTYVGAPVGTAAVQIVGPTLMRFGTADQKSTFLPRIARGEVDVALGYTEPDAGSDLASLRTTAVRDGDDFVVNGVKRFTSFAHWMEYIWLAARTDTDAPKHKGISIFLVDPELAGIRVSPIWTMSGIRTNEVRFENVRVPTSALVGEENRGWYYTTTALDLERLSLAASPASVRSVLDALVRWARTPDVRGERPADRADVRLVIADYRIRLHIVELLAYRVLGMAVKGEIANYEASIIKIARSEALQGLENAALRLLGLSGQLTPDDPRAPVGGRLERGYRGAVADTFGAGSNELMRNIVATRGLGMPRG